MIHEFYEWLSDNIGIFSTNCVLNIDSIEAIINEAAANGIDVPDCFLNPPTNENAH